MKEITGKDIAFYGITLIALALITAIAMGAF